jgi:hypothetical protein
MELKYAAGAGECYRRHTANRVPRIRSGTYRRCFICIMPLTPRSDRTTNDGTSAKPSHGQPARPAQYVHILLLLVPRTDPRDSGGYCETAWTAASEGQQVSDSACGEEGGRQDDGGGEWSAFRSCILADYSNPGCRCVHTVVTSVPVMIPQPFEAC